VPVSLDNSYLEDSSLQLVALNNDLCAHALESVYWEVEYLIARDIMSQPKPLLYLLR